VVGDFPLHDSHIFKHALDEDEVRAAEVVWLLQPIAGPWVTCDHRAVRREWVRHALRPMLATSAEGFLKVAHTHHTKV
jgi:hypothetical protein